MDFGWADSGWKWAEKRTGKRFLAWLARAEKMGLNLGLKMFSGWLAAEEIRPQGGELYAPYRTLEFGVGRQILPGTLKTTIGGGTPFERTTWRFPYGWDLGEYSNIIRDMRLSKNWAIKESKGNGMTRGPRGGRRTTQNGDFTG